MSSNERNFRLLRRVPNMVCQSRTASQYDPKILVKTLKHPDNIIE